MSDDYYDILGVDKNASKEEIKKAYKRLAKKYHPDLNSGNAESEKKFKEVNEAAKVLLDDSKRAQYDRFGKAGAQGGFGGGQGGFGGGFEGFGGGFDDLGDVFESFFGGGFGSSRGRSGARRGSDLLKEVEITLEEAAFGVKKKITVTKHDSCSTCGGRGYEHDSDVTTCSTCHGSGRVVRQQRTPFGVFQTQATCSACGGEGAQIKNPCSTCNGNGKVQITSSLDVDIPAGIETGQRLRLSGQGEAGEKGGPAGDLYVEVHVKEHDVFARDGNNIFCSMKISYAQAVFGDEIEVPTLKKPVKLTIPAGTQGGTMFKLRGKGITNLQAFGSGDQLVKVDIDVPLSLTKKQKELLNELDASLGGKRKKKSFVQKLKDVLDQ